MLNINTAKSAANPNRKPAPVADEGTHLGVIVQVIDLGVQPGGTYLGEVKPDAQKVRITYELVNELHDFDGEQKPLIISEEIKFSGNEKSVCYKRLTSLDPGMKKTGGDLTKLLGMPVMVQVIHKQGKGKHEGKVFANVGSVAPAMKGIALPESTFNELMWYSPSRHDEDVFQKLPEFMRNMIESRLDKPQTATKPAPKATPQPKVDDAPPFVPDASDDW